MRAVAAAQARLRRQAAQQERAAAPRWDPRHHLVGESVSRIQRLVLQADREARAEATDARAPIPANADPHATRPTGGPSAPVASARGNTALHEAAASGSAAETLAALHPDAVLTHLLSAGAVYPGSLGLGVPRGWAAPSAFGRSQGLLSRPRPPFLNYMVMLRGALRRMGFPVASSGKGGEEPL